MLAGLFSETTITAMVAVGLTIVLWVAKEFFGTGLKYVSDRLWPVLFGLRRRTLRGGELRRYRVGIAKNQDNHALGFLHGAPVRISDVYVALQHEQNGHRTDVYQSIRGSARTVVLGPAGAGKSMLLLSSMVRWAHKPGDFERIPVFVELFRRNRGEDSLRDLVAEAFRLNGVRHPDRFLNRALAGGVLSVFFDGFDEVVTERRGEVAHELKLFAERWPDCQVIVTCRDAVYDHELRPNFDHEVRLAEFDDVAVRRFLKLWFRWKKPEVDARFEVEQLMAGLRASPPVMRLARTPLLLTMIVTLHDADPGIGPLLPNSRAEFYETAVSHLLRRDPMLGRHSGLAVYKGGHKLMALRTIALTAQGAMASGTDRRTITESELLETITQVLARFNLDAEHAAPMMNEIVHRSGLLVHIDKNNLLYEFPHLTLQEYLAAMELADNPDRLLDLYRGNPDRWRETVKLWCGGANRDCTDVVRTVFAGDEKDKLLALECLSEARQLNEIVADEILAHFEDRLGHTDDHLVASALGAVAADSGPRGSALLLRLRTAARNGQEAAVDAVAASLTRAAVETLSDLTTTVPKARAALRSMGELAVPVLAERAPYGAVSAVWDLKAIGTPSAATALAELLWTDEEVAVRAAWALSMLLPNPDVEEELRRADLELPLTSAYTWIWEPFSADQPEPIDAVVARIGELIDTSSYDPGDIDGMDPRIALPLSVRAATKAETQPTFLDDDLASRIWIMATNKAPPAATEMLREEAPTVLRNAAAQDPKQFRQVVVDLSRQYRLPLRHQRMLKTLPLPVLVQVATWLWSPSEHVDERDWRRLNTIVKEPRSLAPVGNVALWVLIGALALLGVIRATGTSFGWWPEASIWLSWTTLGALAALIVTSPGWFWKADDDINYPKIASAVSATIVVICGLVLGTTTLTQWAGLEAVLVTSTMCAFGLILVNQFTRRRRKRLASPYRALLAMDEDNFWTRATVISRQRRRDHS